MRVRLKPSRLGRRFVRTRARIGCGPFEITSSGTAMTTSSAAGVANHRNQSMSRESWLGSPTPLTSAGRIILQGDRAVGTG